MKGFKLNSQGDVVISNNKIELVEDLELIIQTINQVLNTNLGEWFNDESEGIDYHVILTKNPNYDLIEDTINTSISQVAETFNVELDTDDFNFTVEGRKLYIDFILTVNETDSVEVNLSL